MTSVESSPAYAAFALQDIATAVLYRLATYAVINLIDDALTVHNPTERMTLAKQWLQTHGEGCSLRDIAVLKSSSGAWLGTADSPVIQQMFDHYYESKAKLVKEVPVAVVAAPEAVVAPGAAVAAKPKVPEPVPAAKAAPAAVAPAVASAVDTAAAVNKGVEAAIAAAATAKMSSTLAKTSTSK